MAAGLIMAILIGRVQANPKYAGIVVDAKSGKVLYSDDPDGLRYPASLTKMMTLYLTFQALASGRIKLETRIPVSANAAKEPPSRLGVQAGASLSVEQAVLALVTRSANDISTALGEYLGGSEDRFARLMTAKARALGMTRTTYRNAHGLPNTAQMTTARDQARLGVALRQHFPQYYGYFNTRSFAFGKKTISNHNRLVGTVQGVDGIKTGYTRAAGSNLVTSAQINGRSIVAVVLGGKSSAARDATMRTLVGEYLPKAASGDNGNLIAARETPAPAAAGLPEAGPVPPVRYAQKAPIAAFAAATPSSSATVAMEALMASAKIAHAAPAAIVAVPAERPLPAEEVRADAKVDAIITASVAPLPEAAAFGWVIQIGASPDENSACGLLQAAQDKGGKALRTAKPFTVIFNREGAQIYRARFGGFSGQEAAIAACKALKQKGMSCWASLQ